MAPNPSDRPSAKEALQLAWLKNVEVDNDCDSASSMSPVSIFSQGSKMSSLSSQPSIEVISATDELVDVLMTDEVLEPLYLTAIKHEKIGGERFERNLRRLLKQHSHNLKAEVVHEVQRMAAQLVQSRARFIANTISSKHDPDARKETQAFRSLNTQGSELGKRRLLDKLLEESKRKRKALQMVALLLLLNLRKT